MENEDQEKNLERVTSCAEILVEVLQKHHIPYFTGVLAMQTIILSVYAKEKWSLQDVCEDLDTLKDGYKKAIENNS